MNKNYVLYFDSTPSLDIADALLTKGVTVTIGSHLVKWATNFDDLGGIPSGIDVTPLCSETKLEKSGIQEQAQWTVTYVMNKDDSQALDALVGASSSSTITVAFPNGLTVSNSGVVAANILSGAAVNGRQEAKCVVNLSDPQGWTKTYPT